MKSSSDVRVFDPIPLWPGGAPGAKGTSSEDCPRLTAVLPSAQAPTAAVVVCPGGGYAGRADHEGLPVAVWLASLGVAGVVLDYRVAPYRHPIPLTDAQRAIRLLRHNAGVWNLDAARVGILGFSAGGHLAASAGTIFDEGDRADPDPVGRISCRPDAMILCYPVITFGRHGHEGSMRNLLGEEPDASLRKDMSLENRVTARTAPAFLWHTADDDGVPVENALLLAGALREAGVAFELHVFPHGPHGLGLAQADQRVSVWTDLCGRWLAAIGFAPPAQT